MRYLLFALLNYLVGSVPWALVIGKLFYQTDVRQYGSGNLGATNVGRTLGKKAAIIVGLLDGFKGFIMFMIESKISYDAALYTVIFVAIGHCYPIFAGFKGGKAVATAFGIMLALSLGSIKAFFLSFLVPGIIWLIISKTTKYVSLASLMAVLTSALSTFIFFKDYNKAAVLLLLFVFVCYRHKDNIVRLINGTENKTNY
ncbi:MAG: glycerol-3-phosphate 1-O-acyltransferase PlsY [Erysipelotrichia bacterium]|nr:glycerol-3-phosphate 1-O-acyltransferase PlsY [Erysipelotrichia bacterium]